MGYEVLGDDYLLLDPIASTVQAMPKPIKLRTSDSTPPDRLSSVLAPDDYCMGYADNEWAMLLSRGLPRMAPLHHDFPIGSIHLLARSDDPTTTCRPADKHQLFRTPFEQTVTAPHNGLDILRCFLPILGNGRVYALRVGKYATVAAVSSIVARASQS